MSLDMLSARCTCVACGTERLVDEHARCGLLASGLA
jgi:hypothetical protein